MAQAGARPLAGGLIMLLAALLLLGSASAAHADPTNSSASLATVTRLRVTPLTSTFNQDVTLSATVTPSFGTATGSVSFFDGTTLLGTKGLVAGAASLVTDSLLPGTHSLRATYNPSGDLVTSSSQPVVATVNPVATTTTLTAFADPRSADMSMSATVTSTGIHSGGVVQFFDGTRAVGSAPLNILSIAQFVTRATWTVGVHSISAVFHPNKPGFAVSVSNTVTATVSAATIPAYAGTGPTLAVIGDSITEISTDAIQSFVGPKYSTSISALVGATVNGRQGVADLYAPTKPSVVLVELGTNDDSRIVTGQQTVDGYKADLTRLTSKFPDSCVVVTTVTTHRTGADPDYAEFDDNARQFNAFLHANYANVVEWDNAIGDAIAAGRTLLSDDQIHPNPAGSIALGMLDKAAVDGCFTKTALTVAPTQSKYGSPVTLTATVTSGGAAPAGTVQFYDGTTALGVPAPIVAGTASITRDDLPVGSHSFRAMYVPVTSTHVRSTSSAVTATVAPRPSQTVLVVGPKSVSQGGRILCVATVSAVGLPPTGVVKFYDGTTLLATVPVSGGHAALATSELGLGHHSLTATFTPTSTSTIGSTSGPVVVSVHG
jgi:hypothetical protein